MIRFAKADFASRMRSLLPDTARAIAALRNVLPSALRGPGEVDGDEDSPERAARDVRELQFQVRHLVDSLFSGEYASVFRGQGLEFSHLREYEPGDDVRAIDWNVAARRGSPYVKQFVEERELTVMLVVDVSTSTTFGTGPGACSQVALELAAAIALTAIRSNDRVGLILVSDEIELHVAPGSGRRHALRVLLELRSFRPRGSGTRLSTALEFVARTTRGTGIVFLISDFVLPPDEMTKLLRIGHAIAPRQDLVPIRLIDPGSEAVPPLGPIVVFDPESNRSGVLDAGHPAWREGYARGAVAARNEVTALFRKLRVEMVDVSTGESFIHPLLRFFRGRGRQSR